MEQDGFLNVCFWFCMLFYDFHEFQKDVYWFSHNFIDEEAFWCQGSRVMDDENFRDLFPNESFSWLSVQSPLL